jgi:lipoate-protein ligase B
MRKDVVWYVRMLEEVMIRMTAEFGIAAFRVEGKTGIWVNGANGPEEKLGAIGVHISRWVTSHGFAYNVSTDLRYFDLIVPCGIVGRKATSLEKLLGRGIGLEGVAAHATRHFGEVFGLKLEPTPRQELLERLDEAERLVPMAAVG